MLYDEELCKLFLEKIGRMVDEKEKENDNEDENANNENGNEHGSIS